VRPVHRLNESYTHTFQGSAAREKYQVGAATLQHHIRAKAPAVRRAAFRSQRRQHNGASAARRTGCPAIKPQCQLQGNGSLLTRGSYKQSVMYNIPLAFIRKAVHD
jgi:hypothetical protein